MAMFPLLFRLARRNVVRNRKRSAVVLVAITIGVWTMVVFGAFVQGWSNDVVRSAVITLTGHVQIHSPGYLADPSVDHTMQLPSGPLAALLRGSSVAGWAARIRVPGVVMSERETSGVTLVGIDPTAERGVSFIADGIKQGRYLKDVHDDGILIGRALAEHLTTGIGKRVVVMSQAADHSVTERGYPVVGIFDADRKATEMSFIFVGRSTAAQMLGLDDRISEVCIMVRDTSRIGTLVAQARATAPNLDVQPWTEIEPMAEAMVSLGQSWIWMVNVVAYIAMGFGLVNTLLMAVLERTRELGLLQALGMRSRLILRQILLESFILIVAGALLGGVLATVTLAALHNGINLTSFSEGAEMWGMSKVIYPVLTFGNAVAAIAMIAILGELASLYPAIRASRRVPVEAITRG